MGLRAWIRRAAAVFRRGELVEDLNEEMRLHVELRARRLRERGVADREAGYMAQRQFGNRTVVLDDASAAWGWNAWERLWQDVRLAARTLRKAPGFTAVAIATLAIGLGINTAIFSVANMVLIRSLPYPHADRLVALWEEVPQRGPSIVRSSGTAVGKTGPNRSTVSPANLVDYRAGTTSFAGLAAHSRTARNLTGSGRPERVSTEIVSGEFFDVVGVGPAMGRAFTAEDDRPGGGDVVILSHEFWQVRMGADAEVLQRSLMLDGKEHRVIGVLPAGFRAPSEFALPDRPALFLPAAFSAELLASHGDHEVNVVGRLKPGVSLAAAQGELDAVSARLGKQYPNSNAGVRAPIASLRNDLTSGVRDTVWALLGASGFIVLIACLNVANLLLVRAVARRHESSVRLAIGASRPRLVRQFLVESLLLAAGGCVVGIALGAALLRVLVAMAPASIPQIRNVSMDWQVFAVCAAIATISGLIFGMAPAWQASDARPAEALKGGTRSTGGKGQVRWRASLTVVEVALSLVLLVGAGLLLKSFARMSGVDLGFQPDRVLALQTNLPEPRYGLAAQRLQFFETLEERVRALPGVQSVAYANRLPMRGGWGSVVELDGAPGSQYEADFQAVSPGYFGTLGIPLLHGRLLTTDDRDGTLYAAVANQAFARRYLNGGDAVGRRVRRGGAPWVTVVGVVNDIRRGGKTDEIRPQIYLPAAQTKLYPVRLADVAVRTSGNPRQLVNAIQEQVWAIDKDQPVTNVRTLEEIVSGQAALRRFQTLLLVVFAGVAVALAIIGIFGVLSYAVSQRTSELGIRVALGASPRDVALMVLRHASGLVGLGVAIGLAGSIALTRSLESLLFDVKRTDWQSYAAAAALLLALGIAAAWIPARRGSKVDPVVALRGE
jgi:putative ABC transport system permease protein